MSNTLPHQTGQSCAGKEPRTRSHVLLLPASSSPCSVQVIKANPSNQISAKYEKKVAITIWEVFFSLLFNHTLIFNPIHSAVELVIISPVHHFIKNTDHRSSFKKFFCRLPEKKRKKSIEIQASAKGFSLFSMTLSIYTML